MIDVGGTPEQEAKSRAFCKEREGRPYNWVAVVAFILPFLRPIARMLPGEFCSEVDEEALQAGGLPKWSTPISTSPNDLFRLATR